MHDMYSLLVAQNAADDNALVTEECPNSHVMKSLVTKTNFS